MASAVSKTFNISSPKILQLSLHCIAYTPLYIFLKHNKVRLPFDNTAQLLYTSPSHSAQYISRFLLTRPQGRRKS